MMPSCLWLTDGGAFCNLGTDWHASRQRIWHYDIKWVQELSPFAHTDAELVAELNEVVFGRYYYGEVQLIVDAALPNFVQGLGLRTPIWEIFRYAIRTMLVMYASTLASRIPMDPLGPCIDRMKRSPSKWLLAKSSPGESVNSSEHSEIGPEPTADDDGWGDVATKEFWERGALQVYIPYQSSVEYIYTQWGRRPRMTPDSKRRWDSQPDKWQKALEALGRRLVPYEAEIVPTTFKSLHEQTLMLVVAGYLNTREAIYGAFDYCPQDIPDKEWFRKLLPSYGDPSSRNLRERLRASMAWLTRLVGWPLQKQLDGLPIIDGDNDGIINVEIEAEDMQEGDEADPERHPLAIALRRQRGVKDARVSKREVLIRRGDEWFRHGAPKWVRREMSASGP